MGSRRPRRLGVLQNGNDPANGIRFRGASDHTHHQDQRFRSQQRPPVRRRNRLAQTEVDHSDLGRSTAFEVLPLGRGGDGTIGFVEFVEEAHDVLEPLAQTNFGV